MECEYQQQPLITLVYFDFRGFGQLIRSLLYYMQVPFNQILIKKGEDFKAKQFQANVSQVDSLPFIIDGGKTIFDNHTLIYYICKKFGHQSLLGENIFERAKIKQIFGKFIDKYSLKMKELYRFIQKCAQNPENVIQLKKQALVNIRKISTSVDPLYQFALNRKDSKYLLGKITLLDFIFYESCFYVTNCFSDIQQEPCKIKTLFNSLLGTEFGKQEQNTALFIRVLKEYKNMFQNEQFYLKNRQKLESYSVCCPNFNQQLKSAYRKIWIGPKHFVY